MQFINTFEGVKTRCVCKPDQTLFSATTNKNGKKRSGHARLSLGLALHQGVVTLKRTVESSTTGIKIFNRRKFTLIS